MSKVTAKLQVTIPKAVAEAAGIRPGTELAFENAVGGLRVAIPGRRRPDRVLSRDERLALFRASRRRQAKRDRAWRKLGLPSPKDRGWSREGLYRRGRAS